jgi:hypothetical protein
MDELLEGRSMDASQFVTGCDDKDWRTIPLYPLSYATPILVAAGFEPATWSLEG